MTATAPRVLYDATGRVASVMPQAAGPVFYPFGLPGGYAGARSDRRALRTWSPSDRSADADTLGDLRTLRGRSRDLIRNAPLAGGAVHTKVTNTVGPGLRLQARIDRDALGLTDEAADAWERQAERIWRVASEELDLTGQASFGTLTQLVFRSVLESGDVLVLRRYRPRPGDLLALKLHLVEADRISNPNYQPDTTQLAGGVEVDADGRPVRYYVANQHPGDALMAAGTEWTPVDAFGAVTGERQVAHVFHRLRPHQRRGVPDLASVIEPLKQLGRYTDAELSAAVLASFFTVFVTSPQVTADGGLIDPLAAEGQTDTRIDTQSEIKLGDSMVVDLAPGEQIQTADPGRPNDKFDPFILAVLRQIGANLEIPFEILTKHFTSSYSASRGALLEFWRAVATWRKWLIETWCQPVYRWVITEAVLRGYLVAPGFTDPIRRAAWLGAEWVGPTPGQLDPKGEVDAATVRITQGFSTIQEETAQLTGGDWERNHVQRVKEVRMRRRDGLDIEPVAERVETETAKERDAGSSGAEPTPAPDQRDAAERQEATHAA